MQDRVDREVRHFEWRARPQSARLPVEAQGVVNEKRGEQKPDQRRRRDTRTECHRKDFDLSANSLQ